MLRSQNRWPTLALDFASLLQAGGGFFGAGFYYKTFMWPKLARLRADHPQARGARRGARCVRAAAGRGRASVLRRAGRRSAARPDSRRPAPPPARAHASCCASARPVCGGELEFEGGSIEGRPHWRGWRRRSPNSRRAALRMLTDTALVGGSGGQLVAACGAGRIAAGGSTLYRVRPRCIRRRNGRGRASDRLRRQRSPGRHAAWRGRTLPRALRCAGRPRSGAVRQPRPSLCRGSAARGGRHARASRSSTRAARPKATSMAPASARLQLRAELRKRGTECLAGHAVIAAEGRASVRAVRVAPLGAAARRCRCRATIACDCCCRAAAGRPAVQRRIAGRRRARVLGLLGAFLAHGAAALAHPSRRRERPLELGCRARGRAGGGRAGGPPCRVFDGRRHADRGAR